MNSGTKGIALLVTIAMVVDVIAMTNSSPQTTEINAKARADTLMKWVNIGVGLSLVCVVIAAMYDRANAKPILIGGLGSSAVVYGLYVHARAAGLASIEEGTEDY